MSDGSIVGICSGSLAAIRIVAKNIYAWCSARQVQKEIYVKKIVAILLVLHASLMYCQDFNIEDLTVLHWNVSRQDVENFYRNNVIVEKGNIVLVSKFKNKYGYDWIYSYQFRNEKLDAVYIWANDYTTHGDEVSACFNYVEDLYPVLGKPSLELNCLPEQINYVWIIDKYKIAVRYTDLKHAFLGAVSDPGTIYDQERPKIIITRIK